MKTLFNLAIVGCLLGLAACDAGQPDDFTAELVVESFQVAGERLAPVRLSRTAPIDVAYDVGEQAVRDAEVRVHLLDASGQIEATYGYREEVPGRYVPLEDVAVQSLRTYQLEALVPGAPPLRATTTVPDTFRVVDVRPSTGQVVYQSTEQLEIDVTRSTFPTRTQSYFIFVTESLDPREDLLTPFAKDLFDRSDGDITLEELSKGSSPVLNEANYEENPDGTLTIRLPWLAVVFYGPNRVSAHALDDNLYDFIRSQSVQQGGSTFSPGEIPNPITRVEGALGVFGSFARVSIELFVEPPPPAN